MRLILRPLEVLYYEKMIYAFVVNSIVKVGYVVWLGVLHTAQP